MTLTPLIVAFLGILGGALFSYLIYLLVVKLGMPEPGPIVVLILCLIVLVLWVVTGSGLF